MGDGFQSEAQDADGGSNSNTPAGDQDHKINVENGGNVASSKDARGERNTCFKKLVEHLKKCGEWIYEHMYYDELPEKEDEKENEIKSWCSLATALLCTALAGISPGLNLRVTLSANAEKVHIGKAKAALDFLMFMVFIIFILCLTMLSVTVTRPIAPRSLKIARTCGRVVKLILVPIAVSAATMMFVVAPYGNP